MATSQSDAWSLNGLVIPTAWLSALVRYICYACLGVGLFFMLPFVFLIVLDFCLWIWRTCAAKSTPSRDPRHVATPKASMAEAASTAVAGSSDNTAHVRPRTRKA